MSALESAGHRFAISDLTRAECLVPVFGPGSESRLADFVRFFHSPNLRTETISPAMFLRASAIRGGNAYSAAAPAVARRFSLADSLHLSVAIESGCDVFLTNDHQLMGFPDILVEQLP